MHKNYINHFYLFLFLLFSCQSNEKESNSTNDLRIEIQKEHSSYFSVNGAPSLLIGGSNNDNIFQDHPTEPQLDTLVKYGGNFIRCTLSSRDFGNQWPYQQRGDALYDLHVFSEAYWNRLNKFLRITKEKGIIVQLEIWDTRDFYQAGNWGKHPFNPAYNVNYSEEVGLPNEISSLPKNAIHPFFETINNKNEVVLQFQEKLIKKLLKVTHPYQHIIYCINNEFNGDIAWSKHWYKFIKEQAKEQEREIIVGDMPGNLESSPNLKSWLDAKEFNFLDLSMITLQSKDYPKSIDSLQVTFLKPITLTKIYGGEQYDFTGTIEDGPKRFWQSVFSGVAAARFHQPPQGAGLNRLAQVNLKSVSMLNQEVPFTKLKLTNELLLDRQAGEAYCLSDESKKQYFIYYPGCGEVQLAMLPNYTQASIKWLNILNAHWEETYVIENEQILTLKSPCEGKWAVFVEFD